MAAARRDSNGPTGGLYAGRHLRARWTWSGRRTRVSGLGRCQHKQWYLIRARLTTPSSTARRALGATFLHRGEITGREWVWLHRNPATGGAGGTAVELLGWFETSADATHLRLELPDARDVAALTLHPVAERDPKCHPLANVPRWSVYQPPFPLRRVVLPASLEALAGVLTGMETHVRDAPRSVADLATTARRAACVLDPDWVDRLELTLAHVERVAAESWLLVDLATFARLLSRAGTAAAQLVTHRSAHGLMSARVEYADGPTRGFALQDVLPFSVVDDGGRFIVRGLRNSRAWRQYADAEGFATLLAAETPWQRKHGDVLSAIRVVGGGELLVTDLPWLVEGRHGPLVAPRLATHLLRMHLGGALPDHAQYWNRWGAGDVLVRDIADAPLRYPELRTVRWAATTRGVAHLGLSLPAFAGHARRRMLIQTGRIDRADAHTGLPAEPLLIFMKWLAREIREQTAWARRYLADQTVTWRFSTHTGLKYAVQFDAATPPQTVSTTTRCVVTPPRRPHHRTSDETVEHVIVCEEDEGLFGDGALEFQDALTARLRDVIEAAC
jgi:hypothetical protein